MMKYGSLLVGIVLFVSACGGSDASDTTTTEIETTTTAAVATTTTTPTAGGSEGADALVPGENPDADEIANVYAVVFDSKATYEDKAPLIVEPDGLEATVAAYTGAGAGVGEIFLQATAVSIAGDEAVVVFDLLFAGNVFQADQQGTAVRSDGVWQVSNEQFCSVMALARVSCP